MSAASAIVVEARLSQPASSDFDARFARVADAVRAEPYRTGMVATPLLQKLVGLEWPSPRNFSRASGKN